MYIEGAGIGTDTFSPPTGGDPLLAGVRRLTLLADEATDSEAIFRGLARELLHAPGAEEVHVHHLAQSGAGEELLTVYMFDGDGRLSYLLPISERPLGVQRVAGSGQSFLAADPRELAASVPRLATTGDAGSALLLALAERGEVEAVVMLVRRRADIFTASAIELATTLVDQGATALALVRARAEAGTDPVTGCMNHRAMRRRLHEEIGRAMRTGSPLSCLLIDLDDFKLVNDRHGHPAGDATLRGVRPRRALWRRRVRRDPAQRRSGECRGRGRARVAAAARDVLSGRDTRGRVRLDRRWPVAGPDERRRAARGVRRCAAALQAPGQGPRHAGLNDPLGGRLRIQL
jgi:Diguanylate cyclase, GGDEF domain